MKTTTIYLESLNGDQNTVCTAFYANRFFSRLRGLLGRVPLTSSQGFLLTPCAQVHTFGMKYPLDIIFIDKTGRITKCVPNLKPNRMAASIKAYQALEMCSGQIQAQKIKVGDQLNWQQ